MQQLWKTGGSSKILKWKYYIHNPTIPCLGIYPKELKAGSWELFAHPCSQQHIHKSQKVETTQKSIDWWMDKQLWYTTYNGTLVSLKKRKILGAPGWLSQLSNRLQLRSDLILSLNHSWVQARYPALCWQLTARSLLQILCLPLSPTLPHSHSRVCLSFKNK